MAAGCKGYVELHGSAEQLAALRDAEDFQRLQADASLIVEELGVVGGFANEAIARQVEIYREAIAQVPQTAR